MIRAPLGSWSVLVAWLLSACLELPALEGVEPASLAGEPDAAAAHVAEPDAREPLRVGAWNVRRLGSADQPTDSALLAQLVDRHFDVLAVLEIMQTQGGGHLGLDELMVALGPAWAARITSTPRPNVNAPFSEFYAVLFRTARVRSCDQEPHLAYAPDGLRADGGSGADRFLREPAFGCFHAHVHDAPGFDFLLGVYHARYGSGRVDEIAAEVAHLDALLRQVSSLWPREQDVLLMGDFNLDAEQLARWVTAYDATRGGGSTLNRSGERSLNLLDHLLVLSPEHTQELIAPAEVLDLRAEAGSSRTYFERLSDHLPIRALFRDEVDDD